MDETGGVGHLLLDFVGGSIDRARDATNLVCSSLLLLLGNPAGTILDRNGGGIESRLCIFR